MVTSLAASGTIESTSNEMIQIRSRQKRILIA